MQRVISDGRAAHPGEVAVLLVVSCYTVRNRFQCLVGHFGSGSSVTFTFHLPCQTMTVDHFYGCHMTISYGTSVDS